MRLTLAALIVLAAGSAFQPATADPYRWCANYAGEGGAGTNCGFVTLEQCRWAVSGNGGSCTPNPFYDGVPAERLAPRRARR
jgi:hypothetical protein